MEELRTEAIRTEAIREVRETVAAANRALAKAAAIGVLLNVSATPHHLIHGGSSAVIQVERLTRVV